MQTYKITPVILCGGSGTRLWPLSTSTTPKQFLKLDGKTSMLAHTAARMIDDPVSGLEFREPVVVGSVRHEDVIRQEIEFGRLILEPFGRNSAPAVAAAALVADPDDLMIVLPADHHILDPAAFRAAIRKGCEPALSGEIVTFGIRPDFASTAYGYIDVEPGDAPARKARKFVEKPQQPKADEYYEAGHYLWNAGIFLFRAGTMIEAFRTHAPEVLKQVTEALPDHPEKQGVSILARSAFNECPDISIDYAIMENHEAVSAVPVEMGWSDVGDFKALWQLSPKDGDNNVLMGPVTALGCSGCYIRSEGEPISVSGLKDTIIVSTADHYMTCAMDASQTVKALAQEAREKDRDRAV